MITDRRVSRRLLSACAAVCLASAGCKTIPLTDDPNAPEQDRRVSPPALYEVEWWKPLVKTGLMEYQPLEQARPAVDPDTERVVVCTRDGFVRSLEPETGKVEWEVKTHGSFFAGPLIADGVIYVAAGDGTLRALKPRTGEELWHYTASEELVTTPVLSGGRLYVASQSETVFAVDPATGKWLWQYRRDAPSGFTIRGVARPAVGNGLVYAGFADGSLVALGADDGVPRWERKLTVSSGKEFLDVDSAPVLDDAGHLYVASYKDGVYGLNATTGEPLWTTARAGVTSLVLNGSVLYATGDGWLTTLETASGRSLWSLDVSDRTSKGRVGNAGRPPMVARGFVILPTSTGLAFVNPSSGKVETAWNPGRGVTATPVRASSSRYGNRLYVLSNLGTVFALQLVGRGG